MQTKNPLMEEWARLSEQAAGLAHAAGEEARTLFRTGGDRFAAEMDLVRRDELDAVKAALSAEIAALRAEVQALRSSSAPSSMAGSPSGATSGSPAATSADDAVPPLSDAG